MHRTGPHNQELSASNVSGAELQKPCCKVSNCHLRHLTDEENEQEKRARPRSCCFQKALAQSPGSRQPTINSAHGGGLLCASPSQVARWMGSCPAKMPAYQGNDRYNDTEQAGRASESCRSTQQPSPSQGRPQGGLEEEAADRELNEKQVEETRSSTCQKPKESQRTRRLRAMPTTTKLLASLPSYL